MDFQSFKICRCCEQDQIALALVVVPFSIPFLNMWVHSNATVFGTVSKGALVLVLTSALFSLEVPLLDAVRIPGRAIAAPVSTGTHRTPFAPANLLGVATPRHIIGATILEVAAIGDCTERIGRSHGGNRRAK